MTKKRILIVDNEPEMTNAFRECLEVSGPYEVMEENDSTKALACIRGFKPELIFLDVDMPKMDGSEVAHQIQSDPSLQHIPIIFLTGMVSKDEVKEHNGVIGGHPFLAKPIELVQVEAAIRKYLKD